MPLSEIDREPRPGEDIALYRIRMLELETDRQRDAIRELSRLRRDGAVAVAVLLVALAIASPQVWGVVVSWCATAASVLRDWRG